MAFENDIKRIDHRNWEDVRNKWLSNIPLYNYSGEIPEHELFEFNGLDEIYRKTNQTPGEYKSEVPNLRSEVLREAIFFIHKATHVCGTAIIHLENGVLSWAISSAYQSSFFALKGILGLVGLSFPRINKSLMIDCFPEEEQLSRNKLKQGIVPKKELKFVILSELTHKHLWQIFQRVLRVSKISILEEKVITFLINLDVEEFSKQRNALHYKNNYWLFPKDLFERVYDENFGLNENLFSELNEKFDSSKNDFSFFICYILLKF